MTGPQERERQLRLFVAIELPDDTRRALADAIAALKRAGIDDGLRWVRPESIHITLKFLGATPPARAEAIVTALRIALRDAAPLRLRPAAIGSFGGARRVRVVWVGLEGDTDALASLASRVEEALRPLGYPTEARAFNPHITLARVRDEVAPDDRARMHAALSSVHAPRFKAFDVARVSLMRSDIGRGGAVYEAIATLPLGAPV